MFRQSLLLLGLTILLKGLAPPVAHAATLANYRGGDTPVLTRTPYDYVPSVMKDGVYRMWWCGGVAGDYILYAEANSLSGPWHARGSTTANSYDVVFRPTGNSAQFDGAHTCDPSVIRVDGTYYMYYGGYGDGTGTTMIGVASSPDGLNWTRLNGGNPILTPARDYRTVSNPYGAGQPSVTYVNGKFHLIYTDTTGYGVDANGGGQFVLRSADPTFQSGVEELTASGFAPMTSANHTRHSLLAAFSVDWQYIDTNDTFAVAMSSGNHNSFTVLLYNNTLNGLVDRFDLAGSWTEGTSIVSRPDKHAIPTSTCGTVPIDILRSVGTPGQPGTWDLAHVGVDLLTGRTCDQIPVGRVYEGYLLGTPGLPMMLVRDGLRLQFALAAPAADLSRNSISVSSDIYHRIPYGASLFSGNTVYVATGRPGAFLMDDGRLWPVSCIEAVQHNNSVLTSIGTSQWDSYARGPSLYCLK
ncbi:beta-xylosidase [Vitiosangium sp. GDMCC 1.1324]|uniref:beta-xylosidase n=1 Tax=Vitiosangium sp. (strain GDMCC 1.1324) TaxID=2138576 RepID=UPI000D3777E0|nr:beta-xylosidase [Vitiosangium sp. GDMCC 1.1324]PTL84964.1 beta-xylosidase [Vitiosangium sp. GDMCC 1.1324]